MRTSPLLHPETPRKKETGINRTLLAGGMLVFLVLAGLAILAIAFVFRGESAGTIAPSAVVYFPGVPDVDTTTVVFFKRTKVGRVLSVEIGVVGIQFLVERSIGPEAVRQQCTLQKGDTAHLAGDIRMEAENLHLVHLRWNNGTLRTERNDHGWTLTGTGHMTLNGDSINNPVKQPIKAGDLLRIEHTTIQWNDPSLVTRVGLALDTLALMKALALPEQSGVDVTSLLGPGASVSYSTLLGLTKPGLQLESTFSTGVLVMKSEHEIMAKTSLNLEELAASISGYLMSPSNLRAPPRNRFEKLIADINSTTENLSKLTGSLNESSLPQINALVRNVNDIVGRINALSREDGGNGLIQRLALSSKQQRQLDSLLASVNEITDRLNEDGGIGRLILKPEQQHSLDSILHSVDKISRQLADTTRPLLHRIGEENLSNNLDSLLASIRNTIEGVEKVTPTLTWTAIIIGIAKIITAIAAVVIATK